MRFLVALVVLGAVAQCAPAVAQTGAVKKATIKDCSELLPAGKSYALAVKVTIDTSQQPPLFKATTGVEAKTEPGRGFPPEAVAFQDCVNNLVAR